MKTLLLAFGTLLGTIAYSQIPTGNMLGEYKFTNGSLNTSVGDQHFTRVGTSMTLVPNRAGGVDEALSLNGDHLQRGGTAGNSLSVSFWIKTSTNDINKRVIIDQSERAAETEIAAETGWYAYLQDGKIGVAGNFQWYHNNNSVNGATGYIQWHQVVSPTLISDGAWHHVAVTIEAFAGNWFNAPYQRTDRVIRNTYIIYIDNVATITHEAVRNVGNATNPQMRRFVTAATPVTVANSKNANSTNRYEEIIDDIRYYNATLTVPQVSALATEAACAGSTGVTAVAKNITIQLDATGTATIQASDINDGSTNSCGDPATTLTLDVTTFTCGNLGENTVTLTAEDVMGNEDTTTATVTVTQLITVTTVSGILVVSLDATGNATITPADIDNGSSSSCGTDGLTMSLSKTTFSCIDSGVTQSVILTVSDAHGNSATGNAFVRAEDTTVPTAVAKNISVQLDIATGLATITPEMLDNGSTDNCSFNIVVSKTVFTCDDIGDNTVTFSAVDGGSVANVSAIVTVTSAIVNETVTTANANICTDGTASTIISTGSSVVGVNYVLRNSKDNSIVDGPFAGTGNAIDFTTGLLGEKSTFNVFAELAGGSSCNLQMTTEVIIGDETAPTAIAQDISISLDGNGNATLTAADVNNGSIDNCATGEGLFLSIDKTSFTCDDIGTTTVTLTVVDASGNEATTTANVTVHDTVAPTVIAKNITVNLDANNSATITAADLENGSTDNCTSNANLIFRIDVTSFTDANVGDNTVLLSAEDAHGNTASATAIVTVISKEEQTIEFTAITRRRYGDGDFTVTATPSSGLEVSLVVLSGPAVLTGNTVHITGAGTVTIEATQAGDDDYLAATAVQRIFMIDPALLTVTATSHSITYGEAVPELTFTYSGFVNEETISALASEPVISTTATPNSNAGTYAITLTGGIADNYTFNLISGVVTINKADLPIGVQAVSEKDISDDPFDIIATITGEHVLTYEISGPATISGSLVTLNGTEGTVIVTVSHAGNINFNPSSTNISFEVIDHRQAQTISFSAIADQSIESGQITLTATATSGLPVTFELLSGPATIIGNTVAFNELGTVLIKATQPGNSAFLGAPPVERSFEIFTITGIGEIAGGLKVYPNPASDYLQVEIPNGEEAELRMSSMDGRDVLSETTSTGRIDISALSSGLYVLRVRVSGKLAATHKIIKN